MTAVSEKQRPVIARLEDLCATTAAVMAAVQDNAIDDSSNVPTEAITILQLLNTEINSFLEANA